jgi:hypothetical protein
MKLTGENQSTLRKSCHSATLSTTNPTWTDPGSNPGLHGERPATNRLSHGTAIPVDCLEIRPAQGKETESCRYYILLTELKKHNYEDFT